MKLLHTADWHLGDRLGRIDRTDDLRRAVERVADYCRQEKVDVLLVAGDVFSELARPDGLREAVRHIQTTFEGFLRDGGTVLAVTGNHDKRHLSPAAWPRHDAGGPDRRRLRRPGPRRPALPDRRPVAVAPARPPHRRRSAVRPDAVPDAVALPPERRAPKVRQLRGE